MPSVQFAAPPRKAKPSLPSEDDGFGSAVKSDRDAELEMSEQDERMLLKGGGSDRSLFKQDSTMSLTQRSKTGHSSSTTFLTEVPSAGLNLPTSTSSGNLIHDVLHSISFNRHVMTQVDVKEIYEVFQHYVKEDPDTVELWDLRKLLKELECPFNEDDLFDYAQKLQNEESITLQEVVSLVENQKKQDKPAHDNETLSAFVAMGGNVDRTGVISTEKLKGAVTDFGFTVDIEAIINEVDDDGNGTIDFDEFCHMINLAGGEEPEESSSSEDDKDDSDGMNNGTQGASIEVKEDV